MSIETNSYDDKQEVVKTEINQTNRVSDNLEKTNEEEIVSELLDNPEIVKILVKKLLLNQSKKENNPIDDLAEKLKSKIDNLDDQGKKLKNNFEINKKTLSEEILKVIKDNFEDITILLSEKENLKLKNLNQTKGVIIENFVDFKNSIKDILKIILIQKNIEITENGNGYLVFDLYKNGKKLSDYLKINSDGSYELGENEQKV